MTGRTLGRPRRLAPLTHLVLVALTAALAWGLLPVASAAAAPNLVLVASGLDEPVFLTQPPDGTNRLFVVEQTGYVRVIENGSLLPAPFISLRASISRATEQGLLGLAFHPSFKTNHRFYVSYTARDGDLVVREYRASTTNPNVVLTGSGRTVIVIPHPPATNHNGGMITFGPDGYLYIGTGDGGGAGDPGNNAQNLNSLLGKILRIDVNGRTGSLGYRIPRTNPFVGRFGRDEIWSYGLRNPWRFSFDKVLGDLWIGDVGQARYEEIDRRVTNTGSTSRGRGANFGWRVMEGNHCFRPSSGCNRSGKVLPLLEYGHVNGRCAVTGGYVYRGTRSPALAGRYIFGDFCSGEIWSISRGAATGTRPTLLLDTNLFISSFGQDRAGEVYVVDRGGSVYRLAA